MKLFFCLALFSLSSAELLFRLPLHRSKSARHHLDQLSIPVEVTLSNRKSDDSASLPKPLSTNTDAHNGDERDKGIGFAVSGSCNISPSSRDVSNSGMGNCYITYGDCGESTSNVPDITNRAGYWLNNVRNQGMGSITITYCSSSTSSLPSTGKELIHNVYNAGMGKIYIKYLCGASPTSENRKLMNDISNAGSGQIYIEYKNCCPSFSGLPSATNICGKMFNNIRSQGSGIVDIKYWDCGSSLSSVKRNANNCGILGHNVFNAGSGFVYITYWNCGGLLSSVPSNSYSGELVDSVQNYGSGSVNVNYGRCSTSSSSVRSNTNNSAKSEKMSANVMPQEALKLNLEKEGTRRLNFKHIREGKSVEKESVIDASVAATSCQKVQDVEEGVLTKMRHQRE